MNGRRRVAAVFSSILMCAATESVADTMTPYQTVVLDWQNETVLIVDMDTGSHMAIPLEPPEISLFPGPIAVDSDGAIFVYYGFFYDGTYPAGSLLAKIDPTLSQWTTMRIEGYIEGGGSDMDIKPDGNLTVAAEFGIFEIDLQAMAVQRPGGYFFPGDFCGSLGGIDVEIDASGTITTGRLTCSEITLFRQTADAEIAERFETGLRLRDLVLESNGSVIGAVSNDQLGTGTLYRLNFDTNAVDVLFESHLLVGITHIELDPDGRIVGVTFPPESAHRVVRVDLAAGSATLIAELDGYGFFSDMDLRIIPEPSNIVLLILGLFSLMLLQQRPRPRSPMSR